MNNDNEASYYERRAEQALALAARATSKAIRDIHLNMASRYATMNEESGQTVRSCRWRSRAADPYASMTLTAWRNASV
ncbi:hypothetical protein [Sphingomonas sp.]|uniref:hypothetical protein n=1 Tax=Sphingomonas sp. TaxID=28214 RepID=UPI0035BBBB72